MMYQACTSLLCCISPCLLLRCNETYIYYCEVCGWYNIFKECHIWYVLDMILTKFKSAVCGIDRHKVWTWYLDNVVDATLLTNRQILHINMLHWWERITQWKHKKAKTKEQLKQSLLFVLQVMQSAGRAFVHEMRSALFYVKADWAAHSRSPTWRGKIKHSSACRGTGLKWCLVSTVLIYKVS